MHKRKHFRCEFAKIGEISRVPSTVHLMALTATASKMSRKIITSLCMEKAELVTLTPNKPNITYHVRTWNEGLSEATTPIAKQLREKHSVCGRTIIYCQVIADCIEIHSYFRAQLGKYILDPPGALNLSQFWHVDMYRSCTHKDVQQAILSSFMDVSSKLRLVIVTIAFGCFWSRFGLPWCQIHYPLGSTREHWSIPIGDRVSKRRWLTCWCYSLLWAWPAAKRQPGWNGSRNYASYA